MKIVKFEDGMYALRHGNWWTGYLYQDLRLLRFTWDIKSTNMEDCKSKDKKEIEKVIQKLTDYGKPV